MIEECSKNRIIKRNMGKRIKSKINSTFNTIENTNGPLSNKLPLIPNIPQNNQSL